MYISFQICIISLNKYLNLIFKIQEETLEKVGTNWLGVLENYR